MKKIMSFVLCVIVLFTVLVANIFPIATAASTIDNYNKNFSLSGNGACDIINVAFAQLGSTGADLGYSGDWCTLFVIDCARLANQSGAFPSITRVGNLEKALRQQGYQEVKNSSPRPGDLCFFNWECGSTPYHVELVYAVQGNKIYTIGGNTGGVSPLRVAKHEPVYNNNVITSIFRPHYSNASAPYLSDQSGTWYYYNNGAIDYSFTGLFQHQTNKNWYYIRNGKIDWNFTGLVQHQTNKNWYYVRNGQIDWSFTGIVSLGNTFYYVRNGMIRFDYTGNYSINGTNYKVVRGIATKI